MDRLEYLKDIVKALPNKPGVYQYYDKNDKIIYVGKAKNLKKRVSSYFQKNHDYYKTKLLVSRINDIKHIVVETESDALLLENNLIKKYQPKFNVRLKDDKSFPWIVVKNEPFPRIFSTRNVIRDGSLYWPYTSGLAVKTLLNLIRQLFPLRNCNYNLTEENIKSKKYKVCLEYHIGNCLGPCEGLQEKQEYDRNIEDIKNILKGDLQQVLNYLKKMMNEFAKEYKFEEANEVKEKINILNKYKSKSTIVSPTIKNVDVFSILNEDEIAYVNFLKVINGAIIQVHSIEMKKGIEESDNELLTTAITEIRERLYSNAREIIVPFNPEVEIKDTKYTVPQRGDKKKLLELSERNLKYFRIESKKKKESFKPKQSVNRIMKTMQKDLNLNQEPRHIECFDNSNIQGAHPVAACVVFKDGKPAKRDYRHYNIKTVSGPDDFASMEEVVYRRYKRLVEEKESLPQLIVIDGGKGQLSSAYKILTDLNLQDTIEIVAIAKRLEEIFKPNDPLPLYLDKSSESLKIIQHLRNEAHRFGITFHRNKRSSAFTKSELNNIQGIGDKTLIKLIEVFQSVENIKKKTVEELSSHIGESKAKLVFNYFREKQK